MESQIERISPVECRVRVEIPWSEVSPRLNRKLTEFRRQVRLPGFRRGKAPPKMVERMFGDGARREVAEDLVQETFEAAVAEQGARALTQPKIEELKIERDAPFVYRARFEVPPEVEPRDYVGVPVRRRPVEITDEAVEAKIERMRRELAETEDVPEDEASETTRPGDVWTLDYEGTFGERPISGEDVTVEIGHEDSEPLPGLAAAMATLSRADVGTSKTVEFVPPEDAVSDDQRGVPVKLTLGLREVRVCRLPDLDDDFARDTNQADTLDELRAKVREELQEREQGEAEREARMRLVQELLARNEFEVPPSMIMREIAARVDNMKRSFAQMGVSLKDMGLTEERLWAQLEPEVTFNVKAFLLLDAIGKAEGIEVGDEEIDAAVAELAKERGTTPERLRPSLERTQELVVLRAQLREEKILDFLMGKAEVTEAPDPTLDDQIEQAAARAAASDDATGPGRRRRRRAEGGDDGGADEAAGADGRGDDDGDEGDG